ncbi:hypothetical protein GCM10010495_76540 [Kitasatospora herbaricolor]|uniref:hypothetical protein n=1 Tax=Kitasatospora herbaricolor TaxID=68217 RepID=UPI00174E9CC6|nr:hypothetical protein [Kitasatospora herbaricolor]MDQ0305528.1 putative P-loop ATPase [Kitasatospora herbaricolor]GGV47575.1 hypothetical protein GCM10010495_76540 [Kitasatospora herbaricolor]
MTSWREFVERTHWLVRSRAAENSGHGYVSLNLIREMGRGGDQEWSKDAALDLLAAHRRTQEAMETLLHLYTATALENGATYADLAKVWGTTRQGARHRWQTLDKHTAKPSARRTASPNGPPPPPPRSS